MSEFGGFTRKHDKTQYALVGLGSTALVAAETLPRRGGPKFLKGKIKCILNKNSVKKIFLVLS